MIPLHDRILVKPTEPETERKSGIVVASSIEFYPTEGIVLAVGKGRWEGGTFVPTEVQVGDRVMFGKNQYDKIELPCETCDGSGDITTDGIVSDCTNPECHHGKIERLFTTEKQITAILERANGNAH